MRLPIMILKPKEVNARKPLYELQELVCCEYCKFIRWDDDVGCNYCALEGRPNHNWSVDEADFCSWAEKIGE